jgi:thiol-disulfide isomerase/thioredoxin
MFPGFHISASIPDRMSTVDSPPTVVLYTREGCGLCDDVLEIITQIQSVEQFELEVVDIDADPTLKSRFGWDIPVVFINGFCSFKHRITPEQFLAKFRRLQNHRRPGRDLRRPGIDYSRPAPGKR